ncbi:hypothetical protein BGW38_010465 [Lunasporangiospora selenospora]|uniref:Uncharacterized protein n=1 Tax=Lunasporangiospora selenospora TaxID=979761 RepID=A0A9P6FW73_9FUNG|nr:hypothetical protein BGW38_010465 [Lunasporangiospora selenospora]
MVPLLIAMIQQCDYGFSTFSFKSSSAMRIFQNDIETERREPQCKVEVHWIIMTIIAALLALMIVSFTTAHTVYILNNRTTIESLQHIRATYLRVQFTRPGVESILEHVYGQDISSNASQSQSHMQLSPRVLSGPGFSVVTMEAGEQLWDRGSWLANWKSIMGPSWWLWFVPYDNTPGDGIHEVYNEQAYKRIVTEAISQAAQNQRHGNSGTTAAARDFVIQVPTVNEGAYVSSTHTSVRQEDPAVAATGTSSSQSTLVSGSMMTTDKRHKNGYHQAHQVASTTSIGAFQQYQQRPGAAQQGAYTLVLQEDDDDDDDDSNSDSDAESSVGSMNRSLPTPHSSPRLGPTDHA